MDQYVIDVQSGSAGFTCDEQLVITQLVDGGLAADAGVELGMQVTSFQGERFAQGFTWSQLKARAKTTPKPWQFGFGIELQMELEPETEHVPIAEEERDNLRKLFRAAKAGNAVGLQEAIDTGVDVNRATRDGWTALLMASWDGHAECVRLLRLSGANVATQPSCCKAAYLETRRLIYAEREKLSAKTLPKEYVRLAEIPPRTSGQLIEERTVAVSSPRATGPAS